jgi:hypothetical protein
MTVAVELSYLVNHMLAAKIVGVMHQKNAVCIGHVETILTHLHTAPRLTPAFDVSLTPGPLLSLPAV